MSNTLSIEINSYIAEIKLNRAEKANAMDEELWFSIEACFKELDEKDNVRVCILSGSGKNFTSGIDIKFLQQIGFETNKFDCEGLKREYLRNKIIKLQDAFTQIEKCRKPVIANIHGACIGGGVDLISACDMRYSTLDSVFQIKEIDFGIVADMGSLQRLPKLIPDGIVKELAFTGRTFSGEEAFNLGFINKCFEDIETMKASTRKIAEKIASKSPLAIRGIKEMLLHARDHSVKDSLEYIATWNAGMMLSNDLEESLDTINKERSLEFKN